MQRARAIVAAVTACCAACCSACGSSGSSGEGERAIRVATWNVHRFFDDRCDSNECAPGSFEALPSTEEYGMRAAELAAAISALEADVVLLQEIENQAALDRLAAAFAVPFESAVLAEHGTDATLDVAVLARATLLESHRHRDRLTRPDGSSTIFSRPLLEAHFSFADTRVIILAAHFRSQRDDDPGRRYAEAEATGVRARDLAAAHPGGIVIAGGDLNDVPGSAPLDVLEERGGLVRLARELSEAGGDATYELDGRPYALDHLYAHEGRASAYRAGSAKVHRQGRGYGGSDHRALSAALLVGE